jgi:MerR family transcriptional regulator, light-induced transcriptional regulator
MTTRAPDTHPPDHLLGALYPAFLAALLAGDRRRCEALTEQALTAPVAILDLYQDLYMRALYQVGVEWEENRISVGIEHLATAIVEGLLNQLYPRVISPRRTGRRIVIGSVEGELHQVGAKMACDVFEMHGWEALYLGADTPTAEIVRTIQTLAPDAVGLSLSIADHLPALHSAIGLIRGACPELPILVGGQGLRTLGPTLSFGPGVHYLADLDDLVRFITDGAPEQPRGTA